MARGKRITRKLVCEGLRRLAFGDVQDAVTLLFESDEAILSSLGKLDLFNVSEIKRAKGGGMEIKFFDRMKALDRLMEAADMENSNSPASFYEALEKSSARLKRTYGDGEYE